MKDIELEVTIEQLVQIEQIDDECRDEYGKLIEDRFNEVIRKIIGDELVDEAQREGGMLIRLVVPNVSNCNFLGLK